MSESFNYLTRRGVFAKIWGHIERIFFSFGCYNVLPRNREVKSQNQMHFRLKLFKDHLSLLLETLMESSEMFSILDMAQLLRIQDKLQDEKIPQTMRVIAQNQDF